MHLRIEDVYNKSVGILALIGIINFLLLSYFNKTLGIGIFYGALIFLVTFFLSYIVNYKFIENSDVYLFLLSSLLVELGLTMLCRINPELYKKQVVFYVIGTFLFILSTIVTNYFIKRVKNPQIFWLITFVFLLLPILFGVERGGAKNWIYIKGLFSFQPSEIAKLFFVFYLSSNLKEGKIKNMSKFILEIFLIIVLLILAKDLGGAMLFYLTALMLIFIATSRYDYAFLGILFGIFLGLAGFHSFPYIRARVLAWLDPWKDVPGRGYQIAQSLFAIAQGGFFGTGLGLGHPEYIPAVATDFIFSAFTEEFGFLGGQALIILYFLLVYRGVRISLHSMDSYLSLVSIGLTVFFGLQVFTIIGGVIKLIPITGVTLPFMSYGGSSMIISFTALGILNGVWISSREEEGIG